MATGLGVVIALTTEGIEEDLRRAAFGDLARGRHLIVKR